MEMERRTFPIQEMRIKDKDKPTVEGYTAVFDSLSEDLGGFREKIAPGFFRQALGISDPVALFNHESNFVLGRQSSGTLRMVEDSKGLFVEISINPESALVRDLVLLPIERGDITGMSFGFTVSENGDHWERNQKEIIRTLIPDGCERLYDVGPVTYPAYQATSVKKRSLDFVTGRMDYERHKMDIDLFLLTAL